MADDKLVKNRILIQFSQIRTFETTDIQEVRCVAMMQAEGSIVADVCYNQEESKYHARIRGLTQHGETLLRQMSTPKPQQEQSVNLAIQSQLEADDSYDRTLLSLACGCIALAFGMLPLFHNPTWTIWMFIIWISAVVLLGMSLFGLLGSFVSSRKAFEAHACGDELRTKRWDCLTALLNRGNGILLTFGVVLFFAFAVWTALRLVK